MSTAPHKKCLSSLLLGPAATDCKNEGKRSHLTIYSFHVCARVFTQNVRTHSDKKGGTVLGDHLADGNKQVMLNSCMTDNYAPDQGLVPGVKSCWLSVN